VSSVSSFFVLSLQGPALPWGKEWPAVIHKSYGQKTSTGAFRQFAMKILPSFLLQFFDLPVLIFFSEPSDIFLIMTKRRDKKIRNL